MDIISILEVRDWDIKDKSLAEGHTAINWQSKTKIEIYLAPKPEHLYTIGEFI